MLGKSKLTGDQLAARSDTAIDCDCHYQLCLPTLAGESWQHYRLAMDPFRRLTQIADCLLPPPETPWANRLGPAAVQEQS